MISLITMEPDLAMNLGAQHFQTWHSRQTSHDISIFTMPHGNFAPPVLCQSLASAASTFSNVKHSINVFSVGCLRVSDFTTFLANALSSLSPTLSADLAQNEYNICIFLQSFSARSQSGGNLWNSNSTSSGSQVTTSSHYQTKGPQPFSAQNTSTESCTGPSNGLFQAPLTTVVTVYPQPAIETPLVATFYADIVPSLVTIASTTTVIITDSASTTSTLTIGTSGLCKFALERVYSGNSYC